MNVTNEFEASPCIQSIGDIENDIPLDWDIEDAILDDLDAQLEYESMEDIWAV